MFARLDSRSELHAEFASDAHGLHASLCGAEGERFLILLNEHLQATQQLAGFTSEVRWRLRKLNYQAIKQLFKQLDQSAQQFVMFVQQKIETLDATPLNQPAVEVMNSAETAPGFRECFKQIHLLSQTLTQLVRRMQRFMDRAIDMGDYATANMVSETLYRANQLICQIKMDVPCGAPFSNECRQPTRPGTYFSSIELWAHSPTLQPIVDQTAGHRH
jgi:DNA-binding ferritin-like protein